MPTRRVMTPVVLLLASVSCAVTPVSDSEADRRELLRLHEDVLDAHLASDIDLLLKAEEDEYVIANRGEVSHPTREQRRARLGPYFESTRFSQYRDLIHPTVEISADGSLGWVIVQVEAQGKQTIADGTAAQLEFVSAWIELYQKRDGAWLRVGNVSNFRTDQ